MARYKRRPTNLDLLPGLFDDTADVDSSQMQNVASVERPKVKPERKPRQQPVPEGPRFINAPSPYDSLRPDNQQAPQPRADDDNLAHLATLPAIKTMKFISFGSGSSGNCSYLGSEHGGILIDAGVDPSYVVTTLRNNGIDMRDVGGIILTHDHGDHVRYAYSLLRANRHLRLYCTPKTLNGILRRHNISRRIKDYHQPIFKEFPFHLGPFSITPFEVSHDGTDNVGFFIEGSNQTMAIATDMGYVTPRADFYLRQANHMMIEANYDMKMLLNGTYPEYLKARIMGRSGHMDNVATARYLAEIYNPALRSIFLCHLSHDNNNPEIALQTITSALTEAGVNVTPLTGAHLDDDSTVQLSALPRFEATAAIILR